MPVSFTDGGWMPVVAAAALVACGDDGERMSRVQAADGSR